MAGRLASKDCFDPKGKLGISRGYIFIYHIALFDHRRSLSFGDVILELDLRECLTVHSRSFEFMRCA